MVRSPPCCTKHEKDHSFHIDNKLSEPAGANLNLLKQIGPMYFKFKILKCNVIIITVHFIGLHHSFPLFQYSCNKFYLKITEALKYMHKPFNAQQSDLCFEFDYKKYIFFTTIKIFRLHCN